MLITGRLRTRILREHVLDTFHILSHNFHISFRAAVHVPLAGRDMEVFVSRTLMVVNDVE
jgi:hypothetical protein